MRCARQQCKSAASHGRDSLLRVGVTAPNRTRRATCRPARGIVARRSPRDDTAFDGMLPVSAFGRGSGRRVWSADHPLNASIDLDGCCGAGWSQRGGFPAVVLSSASRVTKRFGMAAFRMRRHSFVMPSASRPEPVAAQSVCRPRGMTDRANSLAGRREKLENKCRAKPEPLSCGWRVSPGALSFVTWPFHVAARAEPAWSSAQDCIRRLASGASGMPRCGRRPRMR